MIRTCVLEIDNSEVYNNLYDDLCRDYQKYFPILRSLLPIGYGSIDSDGEIVYTSPEQSRQKLVKIYGKENLKCIDWFVNYILTTKASSAYGLLFDKYIQKGSKSSSFRASVLFDTLINEGVDAAIKRAEGAEDLGMFLSNIRNSGKLDDFVEKIKSAQQEISAKTLELNGKNKSKIENAAYTKIWNHHVKEEIDKKSFSIRKIRKIIEEKNPGVNFSVSYPNDCTYCKVLMFVICKGLSSDYKKYLDHVKKRTEEHNQIQKNQLDNNYLLLKKLNALMIDKDLSTKFSFDVTCKKDPMYKDCPSFEEEFSELHDLKAKQRAILFRKLKQEKKFNNNREYPVRNRSVLNPKFLFVESGCFQLSSDGRIHFNLIKRGWASCKKSFQMNDISVEKNKKWFCIAYNNKLKKFTKVGNTRRCVSGSSSPISTVCKTVGLHRRNGKLTLSIFNNHDESANLSLAKFFSTADPDLTKTIIPDAINMASFDLGVVDPIAVAKFEYRKDQHAQYEVRDIGYANLVFNGYLATSTAISHKIKTLRDEIKLCKDFATRFKNNAHNESFAEDGLSSKGLVDKTLEKLSKKERHFVESKRQEMALADHSQKRKHDPYFFLLEQTVAMLGRQLRKLHNQVRNTGYREISEMIRIKECQDEFGYLCSTLRNLFNKGINKPPARKTNFKRINFNVLIARRIAAKVCEYCLSNNINVAFFENLDGPQEEGNNNSIARIFSPRIALDCIRLKLEEKGVGMVEIDKRGTSVIDHQTGLVGYRDKKNHKKLYCVRDGNVFGIDADLNAAINIGVKGMDRSITPYKFWIRGDKDKDSEEQEEYGKRMKKFFMDKYGVAKVDFCDENGEPKPSTSKKLTKHEKIIGKHLYYRNNKYLYTEQNVAEMHNIQILVEQQVAEKNLVDSVHDFMQNKAA